MPNEEIIKFILLSQQSGIGRDEIISKLQQSGWGMPDIQIGFDSIEKATLPKAPSKYQDAYVVSPFKFMFFSIVTVSYYQIYWIYKQWEAIRKIKGASIHSFWRTIIFFYLFSFSKNLNEIYDEPDMKKPPIGLLIFLSIIIPILALTINTFLIHDLIAKSVIAILLYIDILFTLAIQRYINKIYTKATGIIPSNKFSTKEIIVSLIFSLYLIVNIYTLVTGLANHYEKRVLFKNWTVYTGAKGDNFSIEIPSKKPRTKQEGSVNIYNSSLNNEIYEIYTWPFNLAKMDNAQAYLDNEYENFRKNDPLRNFPFPSPFKPAKLNKGTYQGYPYNEYSINLGYAKSKARMLIAGALVYQMTYTSSFYSEEAFQKFVNSLKFVEQPSLVYSHFLAAHSYFVNGEYKKQLDEAQIALTLATTASDKAIAHYWIGLAYFKLNDMAQAETHLLQAVALDPKYAGPYVTLSAIQSTSGNFQKGLEYALKCQELDPKYAWCENSIGLALNGLGKKNEGIVHLQKAVSLDPDTLVFQDNLTRMKQQK